MDSPSGPENTTKVYGPGWVATILTNLPRDGWTQVYCTSIGDSQEHALEACEWVLNSFAAGREAFIRVKPEANSETNFDTKIESHRAIVRFGFRLNAGTWSYPDDLELTLPLARTT